MIARKNAVFDAIDREPLQAAHKLKAASEIPIDQPTLDRDYS
jgi:hypothetical protein